MRGDLESANGHAADRRASERGTPVSRSKMSEALAKCHSFGGIALVGFVLSFFSWQCATPPTQTTPPNSAEVAEGSALEFAVALTRPTSYTDVVTVDYAAAGATADVVGAPAGQGCGDGDYDFAVVGDGTLVWAAGDSADKSVIMTACTDRHHPEADETVTITLSNQSPANVEVDPDNASGVIKSQELPTVTISDVTVSEDAGTADFAIRLSASSTEDITVDVVTSDDTATAGSDYTAVHMAVSVPAGQQVAWVPVAILDDPVTEPTEQFSLQISNPSSNANLGSPTTATGTIQDNDTGTPNAVQNLALACSGPDPVGEYTLTATWDPPNNGADGYESAFSNRQYSWDYSGWTSSSHISYGTFNTGATVTAPGADDYWIHVTPFRGGGGFQASTGVTCDEPNVSLPSALTVIEGASVAVTAALDAPASGTASVAFTTSGATDGGGACTTSAAFYATPSLFTFNAGDYYASVTVHACDDADTADETVTLSLTATGINGLALGAPTSVTVTIADNDCAAGHFHGADPAATGPYCHSNDHLLRPMCDASSAQTWREHIAGAHVDRVVAACPAPTVTASLTGAAGLRLSLEISVAADAVNSREFRVYTTNGGCSPSAPDCAVPGTHYHAALKQTDDCATAADVTTLTFISNAAQTVYLCSLIDVDHGTGTRLLDVVVQDTHPLRPHVYVTLPAELEPPMRGTQ